ncbi:MAG: hypothetical protein JWN23_3156 [Rhodocyclales bacterium]|nr:hypothetical protein [Rhodocyclales bacterium]
MNSTASPVRNILIIEPAWGGSAHFPFNLGLLRACLGAFPSAQVQLLGDSAQQTAMQPYLAQEDKLRSRFEAWPVHADADTLPKDVFKRWRALRKHAAQTIRNADVIILSSLTASMLNAIYLCRLRRSQRLLLVLHGNLNDLGSWRSRNPLRKALDFEAALRRSLRPATHIIALEEHIVEAARTHAPFIADYVRHLPHPRLREEESPLVSRQRVPIKIGFAGLCTIAKGYQQFLDFATLLHERMPGQFECHVIGFLHKETRDFDARHLARPAADTPLSREDFLAGMQDMDLLFFWPHGDYYRHASSGVFYDALNKGLPLLTSSDAVRQQPALARIGISAGSLEQLAMSCGQLLEKDGHQRLVVLKSEIESLRRISSDPSIAAILREIVDL